MLVDSHCHLDYYTPMELPDVFSRAAAAGVGELVTIGTTLAQSERLPPMTEGNPLFVNKNVIEMLALLVVAAHPTGRWLGLDALWTYFVLPKTEPARV